MPSWHFSTSPSAEPSSARLAKKRLASPFCHRIHAMSQPVEYFNGLLGRYVCLTPIPVDQAPHRFPRVLVSQRRRQPIGAHVVVALERRKAQQRSGNADGGKTRMAGRWV